MVSNLSGLLPFGSLCLPGPQQPSHIPLIGSYFKNGELAKEAKERMLSGKRQVSDPTVNCPQGSIRKIVVRIILTKSGEMGRSQQRKTLE